MKSNLYSLKEIMLIFSLIDVKINALNECSSDDFATFNLHLKRYYQEAQIISKNASAIFEIISGENSNNSFEKLTTFQQELSKQLNNFEKQLDYSVQSLENILNNLSQMFVPLKNFKQNLMTLKFLNANMKLNSNYLDKNNSQVLNEEVKNIEYLINSVKAVYPLADANLFKLKSSIKGTLIKLKRISRKTVSDIEVLVSQIDETLKQLVSKSKEAGEQLPELTTKTANYYDSVSKIITNLQYQDIVRQKMELVQSTQKQIVEELQLLDNEDDDTKKEKKQKSLARIRDIAGLQLAHLLYTNREYQTAIEIITNKFFEIGDDMSSIADMSLHFSGFTDDSEKTYLTSIHSKLTKANALIQELATANSSFTDEIKHIHSDVKQMSEQLKKITEINGKFERAATRILANTSLSSKIAGKFGSIPLQMKTLASDVHGITERLAFLHRHTLQLSDALDLSITKYSFENLLRNGYGELKEKIEQIIAATTKSKQEIHALLDENKKLGENITSDIRTSIEEVKYYDLFERVIEEIIVELEALHSKLKLIDFEISNDTMADSLINIEKQYTMKSQRIVHRSISRSENIETNLSDDSDELNTEDNIEFF